MKGVSKRFYSIVVLMILIIFFSGPACDSATDGNSYFTLLDKTGKVLMCTSRRIYAGDIFLNEDNMVYKVMQVKGKKAYAEYIETVDLNLCLTQSPHEKVKEIVMAVANTDDEKRPVAIYHSHSDESFQPTDGTSSIPRKGSIFEVGEALAESLEKQGVQVVHSTRTHDPHDARAYSRSRRTALALLREHRPVALLDVHRDATPPETYLKEVEGKKVARIMLVVGRYNPRKKTNDSFAKEIKAAVDKRYPGLIKGIFYARGTYNQDLAPRSILMEVGTHTLARELAEEAVRMFALAAAPVIQPYATAEKRPDVVRKHIKNTLLASLYFIIIALLGAVGLLVLNGRDPRNMVHYLKDLMKKIYTMAINVIDYNKKKT